MLLRHFYIQENPSGEYLPTLKDQRIQIDLQTSTETTKEEP